MHENSYYNHESDYLTVTVIFETDLYPSAMEALQHFNYLNNMYEVSRLAIDPNYEEFNFDEQHYYLGPKNKSYLRPDDQLYIHSLNPGSLEFVSLLGVAVGMAASVLSIIASMIVIYNSTRPKEKPSIELYTDEAIQYFFSQTPNLEDRILRRLEIRKALNKAENASRKTHEHCSRIDKIIMGMHHPEKEPSPIIQKHSRYIKRKKMQSC